MTRLTRLGTGTILATTRTVTSTTRHASQAGLFFKPPFGPRDDIQFNVSACVRVGVPVRVRACV